MGRCILLQLGAVCVCVAVDAETIISDSEILYGSEVKNFI